MTTGSKGRRGVGRWRLTVGDVLAGLLPELRLAAASRDADGIAGCPIWPPDMFAVAATLLERSDAYAQIGIRDDSSFSRADAQCSGPDAKSVAADWSLRWDRPGSRDALIRRRSSHCGAS